MKKKGLRFRYCKGCKWEFDFEGCKNEYKDNMIKHKDGSLQCGYCAWAVNARSQNKTEKEQ